MTKPSRMGVTGRYSSVASSARSPWASSTGVVWVWKPVMALGLPAWPTTSTACRRETRHTTRYFCTCPTLTDTGSGRSSSSKVTSIRGCMAATSP
ncbi:hypothetical protein EYF80_050790 [Liparis tanakae]|uniref:Uncharacterized protein n=1 Tax=Liparis tanakae TaxID=230148 RepID=A0A4Z2FDI7_9TELE|nr:hypothetical protein EYF80_050790 [Liparis tanakae]